jgi:hypothetical protein
MTTPVPEKAVGIYEGASIDAEGNLLLSFKVDLSGTHDYVYMSGKREGKKAPYKIALQYPRGEGITLNIPGDKGVLDFDVPFVKHTLPEKAEVPQFAAHIQTGNGKTLGELVFADEATTEPKAFCVLDGTQYPLQVNGDGKYPRKVVLGGDKASTNEVKLTFAAYLLANDVPIHTEDGKFLDPGKFAQCVNTYTH